MTARLRPGERVVFSALAVRDNPSLRWWIGTVLSAPDDALVSVNWDGHGPTYAYPDRIVPHFEGDGL